jgi:preprotein translocase subunit SecA
MPTLTPEQLAKLRAGNGAAQQSTSAPAVFNSSGMSTGGSATATSGAAVTAQLVPGLQSQAPRNVQLRKGDQQVAAATPDRGGGQPPEGEKVGRNDPCWCGSGKKFKRCHGAA